MGHGGLRWLPAKVIQRATGTGQGLLADFQDFMLVLVIFSSFPTRITLKCWIWAKPRLKMDSAPSN